MKLFFLFILISFNISFIAAIDQDDETDPKSDELLEISMETPMIRLNSEKYKSYLKDIPRSYSMILMFTALAPERQCAVCQKIYEEFNILARSHRYSNSFSGELFFGMIDYDDGPDVFQTFKVNSVPMFIHFPADSRPRKADQMDRNRWGNTAEDLAKWVEDRTEIEIEVVRSKDYNFFLGVGLCGFFSLFSLYTLRKRLGFVFSRLFWSTLALGVVCFFISGQTWNFINDPPFASQRQNGMEYFADDANMQYVAETYVVFLLYFGVGLGMILLNEAPRLKIRIGYLSTVVAIVGILMVMGFFSYILSVFRSKYEGYPYSFLIH